MRLTKREKIVSFIALAISITVLFITFVYMPLDEKIKKLQRESAELTRQIDEKKGTKELIDDLNIQIAKLDEDIKSNSDNILQIWDQPELLNYLEKTIGKLGEKESVYFADPMEASGIQAGDIRITINTNYKNLQTLLNKFENAKYLNTLEEFNISSTDQSDNSEDKDKDKDEDIKATLSFRFYSQNQTTEYPKEKDYDFIKGKYGKDNIFK